jgi:hypothetical protein
MKRGRWEGRGVKGCVCVKERSEKNGKIKKKEILFDGGKR